jgi:hypothetical protein
LDPSTALLAPINLTQVNPAASTAPQANFATPQLSPLLTIAQLGTIVLQRQHQLLTKLLIALQEATMRLKT